MDRGQIRLLSPGHVQQVNKHGGCSIDRSALLVSDCFYAGYRVKTGSREDHSAPVDKGIEVTDNTSNSVVERGTAAYSGIFLVISEQTLIKK